MKIALLVLLLLPVLSCSAQSKDRPCLIVKHASAARQMFVSGANWQYVAGDFPKGMKWKSNITDRNIRKIKELGGLVVTLNSNYNAAELEQAKNECRSK